MKYRIKIRTYSDGTRNFMPQGKAWYGWGYIDAYGNLNTLLHTLLRAWTWWSDEKQAQYNIDRHFTGKPTLKSTQIKPITKVYT